ncbi:MULTISPECIES: acyltransferase [unclassified Novosphingobium]|uniref:acyltransferase n=1 Tax=unclassified Novosphingobium TaxID=2644732 RepID=UPI000AD531D5|nr:MULTISPECIES: acyltransferase [unclassified Novosphingobium]MBN9142849.1 acyltransferase [Novosphingobium sp.]MDR6705934.1 acetyltransferase-like isoleucine patch superfamily enzyme [Novosphingobium sp. 1748]
MFSAITGHLKRNLSPSMRIRVLRLYTSLSRLSHPFRIWRLRRQHVGAGSYIDKSVNVLGWRNTRIGSNSVICENTCININNRGSREPKVVIGNNCFIGRRNFFSNANQIILKDYCMTGLDCHLNSADHVFNDPFMPYIGTGVTNTNNIILGVNTWLGTDVTILGNVTIGHGCVVGAGSLVTKSAPPFSLLVGSPARVIKRYDMLSQSWRPIAEFTPEMEAMLPDEDSYLATLQKNKPHLFMSYDAAGKCRGDLP